MTGSVDGQDCEPRTFGWALKQLQAGLTVRRTGWNGKGMFLLLAGGYSIPTHLVRAGTPITPGFLESRGCTEMKIEKHIDMWTAQNTYVSGWIASQVDMLALDWETINAAQE